MNKAEHFETAEHQTNNYVIVEPFSLDQRERDHKVILHLVGSKFKDPKTYAVNFLNYHYNYSNNSSEFVKHVADIIESFSYILNDQGANRNKHILDYIQSWLSQTKSQRKHVKGEQNSDPQFEEIFKNTEIITPLIKQLILKDYVEEKTLTWKKNKNQLVALQLYSMKRDLILIMNRKTNLLTSWVLPRFNLFKKFGTLLYYTLCPKLFP